jgi:integrase
MTRVELKGIAKVTSKGREYWYAWRGGPRLRGKPGSPEFLASYNEAIESLKATSADKFHSVITQYKTDAFKSLAASTRSKWMPWIDRIGGHFGKLSTAQFDRPEKIRPVIIRWRNQWANTPRTADYGMQVLSSILSYAVDPLGKISRNPCEGIKRLYSSDRSAIIWTDADIAQLKDTAPPEIAWAVDLAAHTGLRLGDLLRLSWSHIGEKAITITTGKSNHRREAIIPLYDALRAVLAQIPKRATTVLTSTRNRPWTVNGFGTSFDRVRLKDRNLHFHDLRGTAATRFYVSGIPERAIAEIMGWEEEQVSKIIRRYVSRTAAIEELIRKLNSD